MFDKNNQFQAARLKAIREHEKQGKDAYLPANAWGFDLSAIDRTEFSQSTKDRYRRELIELMNSGINPFDFEALQEYAAGLKPPRRNLLRLALRLMALEMEQSAKASATPENLPVVQALVMRLEAIRNSIKANASEGAKTHIWLSSSQVQEITGLCGDDMEGKRDWIILGLLLGAGLQRAELIAITFNALKQQGTKDGKTRYVLQVTGYGAKDRVVPISPLLAARLREWKAIVGGGNIARSYQNKKLGASISSVAVHQIVRKCGTMIGLPGLKTNDLRRTYAQLAYNSGLAPIQIKELMGHARLSTTQRHLKMSVDLDDVAGDFVPLAG